jgi:DNA-binding winged helix-turn-helix (wHTH) protein
VTLGKSSGTFTVSLTPLASSQRADLRSGQVPVRFGEFSLDPDRRQVLREGAPVPLEPKAWDLLSLLVARRPKALSKAQIRDVLWPGTFVSETVLAGLVADIRSALGDDARQPRFIRTLHGFGYAFCGTVEEERAPAPGLLSGGASGCRLLWAGREIPLPDGEHLLGRDEGCLVRSRSVRVSRHHAKITVQAGRAIVEDLGSRNGTSVGGRCIEGPVELALGDTIEVGPEEIVFLGPGGTGSTVTDRR